MDSESRAFEASFDASCAAASTPLPCHRPMVPQALTAVTPGRLLLGLVAALSPVPLRLSPALIKRRRA